MAKSKQTPKVDFDHFIEKFPEVELPITLSGDLHHVFSKKNDPFHPLMVQQFIEALESDPIDEYTEFIPCFRLKATYDFHAIVYWRAGLLNYAYKLVTFDKKGGLINQQVIAGTKAEGELLVRSVATIEDDWTIYIVGGVSAATNEKSYDASSSQTLNLELLATGQIVALN